MLRQQWQGNWLSPSSLLAVILPLAAQKGIKKAAQCFVKDATVHQVSKPGRCAGALKQRTAALVSIILPPHVFFKR